MNARSAAGVAQLRHVIQIYKAGLEVITESEIPIQWATIQNNLGVAYTELPHGDRTDNLQRAIACFQAALRVRTENDFPVDWMMTQISLGNAYRELPCGDRADNL